VINNTLVVYIYIYFTYEISSRDTSKSFRNEAYRKYGFLPKTKKKLLTVFSFTRVCIYFSFWRNQIVGHLFTIPREWLNEHISGVKLHRLYKTMGKSSTSRFSVCGGSRPLKVEAICQIAEKKMFENIQTKTRNKRQ